MSDFNAEASGGRGSTPASNSLSAAIDAKGDEANEAPSLKILANIEADRVMKEEEEKDRIARMVAMIEADVSAVELAEKENEAAAKVEAEMRSSVISRGGGGGANTHSASIAPIKSETVEKVPAAAIVQESGPDETFYMVFRCYGTGVTNFNFKGLGISGFFSFGSPKNEKRLLRISRSQPFPRVATRAGQAATGYEVIYESETFEDGKPDFFPSLVANMTIDKDMDCKLRCEVYYCSSKTGDNWVYLTGNTITFRESVRSVRSSLCYFVTPMVSEHSIGGALQIEFIAQFPRLLTVHSLCINSPTGYMNPLVQRYVFYNDANRATPIIDVEEVIVEPRLTLRASSMVIQASMVTIEKSMDAWKKRYHIERMRQGYFRDLDEVFKHGWHHVQVSIQACRMKLKNEKIPKFEKLPENHARRSTTYVTHVPLIDEAFVAGIVKARNSTDLSKNEKVSDHFQSSSHSFTDYSIMSASGDLSTFFGSSIVRDRASAASNKKVDEMYPSTFVSCRINDHKLNAQLPIGRTNTEYYCADAFYGSNINANVTKSKPHKNFEYPPNVYVSSNSQSFLFGQAPTAMYAESPKVVSTSATSASKECHVADMVSMQGSEVTFNIFVPTLDASVDFDLHLEEYLSKIYGSDNNIAGSVSLNLSDCIHGTIYDWFSVNLTNIEAGTSFEAADLLLKVSVMSGLDDYRGKMVKTVDFNYVEKGEKFKIYGQDCDTMYEFCYDALPSSDFYLPYSNKMVYTYDRTDKTIQYNTNPFNRCEESSASASSSGGGGVEKIGGVIVSGDDKAFYPTDRSFHTVLDEKCLIADCYEWLYSIGYSGYDPLIALPSKQAPKKNNMTYVSYCLDEVKLLEGGDYASYVKYKKKGISLFPHLDGPYSLVKIMGHVQILQQIVDELVELQIELSDMMQKGLAFRPSGMKKSQNVQSLPTNFHYQFNTIRAHTLQSPNYLTSNPVNVNSNVTHGCFTSHKLGFKHGGILLQEMKLLLLRREIDDAKVMYARHKEKGCPISVSVSRPSAFSEGEAPTALHTDTSEIMTKVGDFDSLCIQIGFRRVFVMSQALSVLINSLHMKLCMVIEGYIRHEIALKWLDAGFLLMFQGLLSISGHEKGMLEDTICAIESLNLFQVKLLLLNEENGHSNAAPASVDIDPNYDVLDVKRNDNLFSILSSKKVHAAQAAKGKDKTEGFDYMSMGRGNFADNEKGKTQIFINGREVVMYIAKSAVDLLPERFKAGIFSKEGLIININAILFSQGIDIQQSIASTFSSDAFSSTAFLQSDVNMTNLWKLNEYAKSYFRHEEPTVGDVHKLCVNLKNVIEFTSSSTKNVGMLNEIERINGVLHGCLATFCKSGKDRTGMVVSHRESRTICESYGCGTPNALETSAMKISSIFREYGCRLRICEKNTGKRVYAFNKLQKSFLPEIYRPPDSVLEDLVKTGADTT